MSLQDTILGPGGKRTIYGPGGKQQPIPQPSPSPSPPSQYDFSKSNLILMVGGQVLLLVILLMIVMFGTAPLTFPAQAVRNALSKSVTNTK
jgi:hypothetical protein